MEYIAIFGALIILVAIFYNPEKPGGKRYQCDNIWGTDSWCVYDTAENDTIVGVFDNKPDAHKCAAELNEG